MYYVLIKLETYHTHNSSRRVPIMQQLLKLKGHIDEFFNTPEHIIDDIFYMRSKPTIRNKPGKFRFYYVTYSTYILDLKDIHQLRYLGILAGVEVKDLLNVETGKVYDSISLLMDSFNKSSKKRFRFTTIIFKLVGAFLLALSLEESKPFLIGNVKYYWRIKKKETAELMRETSQGTTQSINCTLISLIVGLFFVTRPFYVSFVRFMIPHSGYAQTALINDFEKSDKLDKSYNTLVSLSQKAHLTAKNPTNFSYAMTNNCLENVYPSLHKCFVSNEISKTLKKKTKVTNVNNPTFCCIRLANNPPLCRIRLALLKQKKVRIRPIHFFRKNGKPRESIAEIALAFLHYRLYSELIYMPFQTKRNQSTPTNSSNTRKSSHGTRVSKKSKRSAARYNAQKSWLGLGLG